MVEPIVRFPASERFVLSNNSRPCARRPRRWQLRVPAKAQAHRVCVSACVSCAVLVTRCSLAGRCLTASKQAARARCIVMWNDDPSTWFSKLFQPDTSIFKQTRQYSTGDAVKAAYRGAPIGLKDLSRKFGPNVPITSLESPLYRIFAFILAFLAYPGIVRFLRYVLQLNEGESADELADVVTDFVTVETFVFGSYSGVTLTLQIQRLADLQTNCVRECALLSSLAEHTVELFESLKKDTLPETARKPLERLERQALEALWHHSERLAFSTRGEELLDIAERRQKSDGISNYRVALLQWGRQRREGVWSEKVSLYEQDLQLCMTMVNTLKDFRAGAPGAGRLSRESLVLPPTFFWTFGLLSIFISISFALREAADPNSEYSIVDRCFFAALTLAFLTLFRLAVDVNYPFKGDYQIRRGSITAELISARDTLQRALNGMSEPPQP
ncbi:unnamed protein product [Durusdinium trenchii]|uniref:Uncharacterized protein n=1 Tax=Durusdinium trenchii TaxID=1381693 RepID=A0ABP0L8V6_9DINO